ncbi:sigma-54 dependent transcriptional regulator [Rhodocaloribacter litoris]|uniref:sigma-54 interaction domain-containing protein n=1 Tax=Rhodocaloribacter litoris TaxID=2558931 RepID=UPI0014247A24|nr:sigma-54 dependent transcriptional regulator [Rhodocaloribacter litoris]QXD15919.1 sigma-54 dependent transcriptional regulator [Rhodocaloribacter litoris]
MDRAAIQERFGIIGSSPALLRELDRARQVAQTDITVLIEGESGVGKELFAQAIHEMSHRRHKPLVVVNCGAIPEGLIESELFGNEKGAYTGAVERRSGYFEQADGSTIFLDEIGEMPPAAQVRLLRVLETGTFSRVGSSTPIQTDVRVIAATNKDLAREVQAGRFREDLYYRLSTVLLKIPPLRERKEDIIPIFEHFLHRFAQKYNSVHKRLTEEARQLLKRYRWPGNVRELRNVAEQAVVLHRGDTLTADDLRPYLRGVTAAGVSEGLVPVSRTAPGDEGRERELIYRALLELRLDIREMKEQLSALLARLGAALPHGIVGRDAEGELVIVRKADPETYPSLIEDVSYEIEGENEHRPPIMDLLGSDDKRDEPADEKPLPTLEDAERQLITEALRRFDGNRRQTARALGISERTLYRKLKEIEEEV